MMTYMPKKYHHKSNDLPLIVAPHGGVTPARFVAITTNICCMFVVSVVCVT